MFRVRSQAGVDEFKQLTAKKLEYVRCPQHGQAPRLKFVGDALRDVEIRMSGCCDQLLLLANRAIANIQ